MFKKRVWICGFIIILLYWTTWYRFQDVRNPALIDPYLKHIPNFGMIILVGITGWIGWKYHEQEWIRRLWSYAYIIVISFLIFMGAIDLLAKIGNESLRNMLSSLRMFFTSPVPYGILIYLGRREKNLGNKNKYQEISDKK